ncbi:MAG: extracellular solute-binding protein [Chloroflexi bacterium]|uniref:extracellular solute-binding protein n=1 Tax=Candidatus Flexifilum breve TaxID=3140694 RepID=UPI0031347C5F|nr:extracellular solute-binding protein [Chloroflexota bacterium]
MKTKVMLAVLLVMLFVVPVTFAQEPVTITFWHTYNEVSAENQMLTETLIPAFEAAHPEINVESVAYPYDGFRQALLTSAAGGEGPDLVRLDIIWSPEFAAQGILLNLSENMSDFQTFADAVFPGPLSTNAYDGAYYGLPLDTNTRVFIYNPAVMPEAPETIDDLAAMCESLPEGSFLFSDGGTSGWNMLPWIWSFGGDITDPDITTSTGYVNGEQSVAAIQFLTDMVQSGCFSDGYIGSGLDTWGGYFGGTISSMLEGPWFYPTLEQQYPDFEAAAALMPAGDGGHISVVGGENIVVMASSQQQAAALEFLRFTQSDEYQLQMSTVGQLTVLSSLLENEYFTDHPYYGVFLDQLQTAKARTPHPAYNEIETVLSDAAQLALRGEMSAQEAMDLAAEEIDALLAGS